MGHDLGLLNKVMTKLQEHYPMDEYEYVFEERLHKKKDRMYPDIQILKGDVIKCVVEIGYTRPEKLKRYRELHIQDIRWYSKESDLMNEQQIVSQPVIEKIIPNEDVWSRKRMLTTRELAEYLGMAPGSIRNIRSKGDVGFVKARIIHAQGLVRGSIRYLKEDVDRWIDSLGT